MANTKAVSDEKIIAALMTHGTIKAAAGAAGITPRAIYERMKDPDFRSEYMEAKNDLLREAVHTMNGILCEAIETIADIMRSEENNPAIRLQAAQTIINSAGKFADRLTREEEGSREAAYEYRTPESHSG